MRGKYNNIRTEIDGLKFDSRGESRRYLVLKSRLEAGLISDLETQVSYRLSVNGLKIADYRADFRYRRDGEVIVEDFKSPANVTSTFKLKAKLMQAFHGITVHVTMKPDAA